MIYVTVTLHKRRKSNADNKNQSIKFIIPSTSCNNISF